MSEQDETLVIVTQVLVGIVIPLASAARADMGELAENIRGLGTSPQFDPKARQVLTHLANEIAKLAPRTK